MTCHICNAPTTRTAYYNLPAIVLRGGKYQSLVACSKFCAAQFKQGESDKEVATTEINSPREDFTPIQGVE